MLIGQDFEKISFEFCGTTLLEPNAFVGDTFIFLTAFFFAFRIGKFPVKDHFLNYWKWFYFIFGFGFLVGGFSHLFFNVWGVTGKYIPWYSGIISVSFCEFAMISIFPNKKTKIILMYLSLIKLALVLFFASYVYLTTDLTIDLKKGLMIPTINSVVGLAFSLIILGSYYERKLGKHFKYFWMSGIIIFPSAVVQVFKINIHPWMDRNDVSHVLLIVSSYLYYLGIKGYVDKMNEDIKAKKERTF